jgi:hypothetical protein
MSCVLRVSPVSTNTPRYHRCLSYPQNICVRAFPPLSQRTNATVAPRRLWHARRDYARLSWLRDLLARHRCLTEALLCAVRFTWQRSFRPEQLDADTLPRNVARSAHTLDALTCAGARLGIRAADGILIQYPCFIARTLDALSRAGARLELGIHAAEGILIQYLCLKRTAYRSKH